MPNIYTVDTSINVNETKLQPINKSAEKDHCMRADVNINDQQVAKQANISVITNNNDIIIETFEVKAGIPTRVFVEKISNSWAEFPINIVIMLVAIKLSNKIDPL